MDKLKYIKLENEDGSYSSSIPLAVDSDYVDVGGSTLTNKLETLATKTEVQAVASGSPAGIYNTVSALTTADPDHSKIYLVIADGHWYYYANNQWNDGGVYQAAEDSTTVVDLTKSKVDNLSLIKFEQGGIINNGQYNDSLTRIRTKDFLKGTHHIIVPSGFKIFVVNYYDENTQQFDSSVTINAREAIFYKSGCVAKFSVCKNNTSANITPSELLDCPIAQEMKVSSDIVKPLAKNTSLNAIYEKQILTNQKYEVEHNMALLYLVSSPEDFATICCTDVICNSKQKLMYKGYSSQYYPAVIFMDYFDNVISVVRNVAYQNEFHEIAIPEGTEKAIIQGNNAYNFDFYLTEENTISVNRENIDYKSILTNKKWSVCGDSFSHGDFTGMQESEYKLESGLYAGENKVYAYYIGNRTGVNVNMLAGNGMTLAKTSANYCFAENRYQQIPEDVDYVTLYFGINDNLQNVPIGTDSSTDITTFKGAWNTVLNWLRNNRPFAHVGIVVTNKRPNEQTPQYLEATRTMAKKYGYPILDLEKDTQIPLVSHCNERDGLDPNIKALVNDQFRVGNGNEHPNPKAHEIMSCIMENFLHEI